MPTCLFYLAEPKFGGWPTFTSHLYRGLAAIGKQPVLFKISDRSDAKPRNFGRGLSYTNISERDAVALVRQHPSLLTAVGKGFYDIAARLLEANAAVCVHDPTELKEPFASAVKCHRKVIVIRQTMQVLLPQAQFIKHPYWPMNQEPVKTKLACAISRIDHDKNTHIIAEANKRLAQPVELFGAVNRIYSYFTLDKKHAGWQRHYGGSFTHDKLHAGASIASRYQYMVDLSVIKKDGEGTQYTFLEAIDAGCQLILHEQWRPTGLLKALSATVNSADALVSALEEPASFDRAAAETLLAEHAAERIAATTYAAIS